MKEREANEAMAATCATQRWCCDGRCAQGRRCPAKEDLGPPVTWQDSLEFWLFVGLALCALVALLGYLFGWLK